MANQSRSSVVPLVEVESDTEQSNIGPVVTITEVSGEEAEIGSVGNGRPSPSVPVVPSSSGLVVAGPAPPQQSGSETLTLTQIQTETRDNIVPAERLGRSNLETNYIRLRRAVPNLQDELKRTRTELKLCQGKIAMNAVLLEDAHRREREKEAALSKERRRAEEAAEECKRLKLALAAVSNGQEQRALHSAGLPGILEKARADVHAERQKVELERRRLLIDNRALLAAKEKAEKESKKAKSKAKRAEAQAKTANAKVKELETALRAQMGGGAADDDEDDTDNFVEVPEPDASVPPSQTTMEISEEETGRH